jgi:hypothetical protein
MSKDIGSLRKDVLNNEEYFLENNEVKVIYFLLVNH